VTDQGRAVAALYGVFLAVAAFIVVLVAGLIAWSIVRYRDRGEARLPPQRADNGRLELTWWAIPTLVVVALFVYTTNVLSQVDAPPPGDAVQVEVEGFQWQWRFTYPDSGVTVTGLPAAPPEITLPVGRAITFHLSSPDVVHSFYVPRFLVKRDAVPGLANEITVTIREEGTYSATCAEFCGLLHDQMRFSIRAVSAAEFEAWLAAEGDAGS
jgi:cytochrome c oxidase subunit 2